METLIYNFYFLRYNVYFQPVLSQSVTVLSGKPVPQPITAAGLNNDLDTLSVIWKGFVDPDIGFNMDTVHQYEVSVYERQRDGAVHFILPWTFATNISVDQNAQTVGINII